MVVTNSKNDFFRFEIKGFKIDQKEINKQVVDSKQYRQEARKGAEKRLQQEKLQMNCHFLIGFDI